MNRHITWNQNGRESLTLDLLIEDRSIQSVSMKATGCLSFLKMSQKIKTSLSGPIEELQKPQGSDHSSLIWQEIILEIKNQWNVPIEHKELCHCRKVNTDTVDRAIVYGAHNIEAIRLRTSANTGCGTCKEDVEKMIKNRIKSS